MYDNDMVNPPGGGAWTFVEQQSVTNGDIQFTNLEDHRVFRIFYRLQNTGTNVIYIRMNNDTGANYFYCRHEFGDLAGAVHTETHAGISRINMTPSTLPNYSGEISIFPESDGANYSRAHWLGYGYKDTDEHLAFNGGGIWLGSAALNRIDLTDSAGNNLTGWATLLKLNQPIP